MKQQFHNQCSGFVADGLERLLRSPEFREKRAAVEAQVRADHAAELAAALVSRSSIAPPLSRSSITNSGCAR